jgi:hypothetical protein
MEDEEADWVAPLPHTAMFRCVTYGGRDAAELLRFIRRLNIDAVMVQGSEISGADWQRLRSPTLPALYYEPCYGLSIVSRVRLRNPRVLKLGAGSAALIAEANWGLIVCACVRDADAARMLVRAINLTQQCAIVGGAGGPAVLRSCGWDTSALGMAAGVRGLRCFSSQALPLAHTPVLTEWESGGRFGTQCSTCLPTRADTH